MTCPLCGSDFAVSEARSPCGKCPLRSHCDQSCCPRCGYAVLAEPHWLSSLRRRFSRKSSPVSVHRTPLTAFPPGESARIVQISPSDRATWRKLLALGLLPGSRLRLLRRFPCYLIEVGYAQMALDSELALAIWVQSAREI